MTVSYGKDWAEDHGFVVLPMSAEKAQLRYNARQPFSAIILIDGRISRVVSFLRDYVGVRFYDPQGRCDLRYDFDEIQPNRLFLKLARHQKYEPTGSELAEVEEYRFDPKGTCSIESTTSDRISRVSPPQQEDVTRNWEPYPQFHDLTSIIRRER